MPTSGAGSIVGGLLIVFVAGCLNGSWNASFSPTWGLAVGRVNRQNRDRVDLDYHFAWVLFQIYGALVNIPICLFWAGGPARVHYVVSQSSAKSLALVILFSLLWGVGTVGFGLACRIAGVGLGTNLIMGVIMILGTFLPLCIEHVLATAAGGVIIAGLVLSCIGLYYSVKSLQTRDSDERKQKFMLAKVEQQDPIAHGFEAAAVQPTPGTNDTCSSVASGEGKQDEESGKRNEQIDVQTMAETDAVTVPAVSKVSDPCEMPSEAYSTWQKISVCIVAGAFASQLQFAFIFGDPIKSIASSDNGPGSTPSGGASAIIWLFAISVSAPVSIIYGLWQSPSDIPLSTMWRCPWYRHGLVLLTTSLPWICPIHLYGYSNTYLPAKLGASVAWPILMMVTVIVGFLWSIVLGEWAYASTLARRQLKIGLALVALGVATIMASVAVQ